MDSFVSPSAVLVPVTAVSSAFVGSLLRRIGHKEAVTGHWVMRILLGQGSVPFSSNSFHFRVDQRKSA